MDKDKFDQLMEKAKQESKKDFLSFITGIYGTDESLFEHIWEVPIIAPWEGDILVKIPLSTKTEEELLDVIDEFIADELGDSEGCFISLGKMAEKFTEEELEEWKEKLDNGELKLDFNAIIVYNESLLQKEYKELVKENSISTKQKTQEELELLFVEYLKKVITHERCHLNANYYVTEVERYVDEGAEKREFTSYEVNGASLSDIEQSNLITHAKDTQIICKYNGERNEVLVDTLSQMINNYQEGDSIEECLYKIIKARNGKSQYSNIDDREVLTMYTLFTEELTEWATFGAYDFYRENKLQKKIIDVCGTDEPLKRIEFNKKVEKYVSRQEEGALSKKQTEMLEMLGFSINKKICKEDMKEVATSENALEVLPNVEKEIKNMQKEDTFPEK